MHLQLRARPATCSTRCCSRRRRAPLRIFWRMRDRRARAEGGGAAVENGAVVEWPAIVEHRISPVESSTRATCPVLYSCLMTVLHSRAGKYKKIHGRSRVRPPRPVTTEGDARDGARHMARHRATGTTGEGLEWTERSVKSRLAFGKPCLRRYASLRDVTRADRFAPASLSHSLKDHRVTHCANALSVRCWCDVCRHRETTEHQSVIRTFAACRSCRVQAAHAIRALGLCPPPPCPSGAHRVSHVCARASNSTSIAQPLGLS